ncbi:hypothetical protein [Demequina rhizosphaerae]|uniref:hypothetical protein n=1 Tax=Demequina rhizosphaerae TaxID=1638985 RepID=UPI0007865166|nr:hypothetical protein [Demequina rhizosphaerae]
MEPVTLVEEGGGTMRRAAVLAAGTTRWALDGALSDGLLIAPVPGVIALPTLSEARLEAARLRSRLTCVSAIAEAGLPVMPRTRVVHVAVQPRGRTPRRVATHRFHFAKGCGSSLAPMPVPTALDHAGRCVGPRAHLVMLDAALRRGLVRGADLDGWIATPRARRRWLLARADARAESAQETLARIDLVEAGLRAVPQVYVDGVGRVDLVVEGRLALEIDGRSSHDDDDAFTRDRRRDRGVLKRGVLAARFTAAEVEAARPGEIAAAVRRILAAHRRAGRPIG